MGDAVGQRIFQDSRLANRSAMGVNGGVFLLVQRARGTVQSRPYNEVMRHVRSTFETRFNQSECCHERRFCECGASHNYRRGARTG